ncbi:migration and invasion-inhibitory protein-like [Corticium candelabrum]|uniref:migration and invasion-inhibitory protein-like n=1 Tax=Corticium candelabrum TaxID=121492 RepID=UPI002E2560A2|nr:migration and invasion-inhibitory protein-like [Corticium candelabrum]
MENSMGDQRFSTGTEREGEPELQDDRSLSLTHDSDVDYGCHSAAPRWNSRRRDEIPLGYDWIAGLLDGSMSVGAESESFYDELRKFRRVNREECSRLSLHQPLNREARHIKDKKDTSSRMADVNIVSNTETSPKYYKMNERLFPIPYAHHHNEDTCLSCDDDEKSQDKPNHYIRVSVPRSFQSPLRRPRQQPTFSPSESVDLSKHCLPGWEASHPSTWRVSSPMNLTASVLSATNELNVTKNTEHNNLSSRQLLDQSLSFKFNHLTGKF